MPLDILWFAPFGAREGGPLAHFFCYIRLGPPAVRDSFFEESRVPGWRCSLDDMRVAGYGS